MSQDISYTTEEIAKLLKISKLTVYDLIKKGEIPAYRVGKQMRVDASDLEAYKQKKKSSGSVKEIASEINASHSAPASAQRSLVITGQDMSLDILAKYMESQMNDIRPLRSYVGSLNSLISMYRGESDIVSTHLWDSDSGEYNVPYIRKLLVGFSYIVINLAYRKAGFYVAKGNPKQLLNWSDLTKPGIRIVNREKGSGARVLLDEKLRIHGISPHNIAGYDQEESNHLGVAGKVSLKEVDVGVGIEKAANIVGVHFVPLIQERYDLVLLKTPQNEDIIQGIKRILKSDSFQKELSSVKGYDLSKTGEVIFET
ncbi:helix-turn-helix transcriptional regulator [Paenibacillus sediminis]|uniref:Molybdopterin biosynthesis protein n=1 Tax=Paenibacillus sediminis TaxID=664909 RepID=A0ABS4H0D8_9BACL|nr:helix-turn-helix transcriptional regulator [Paenibacillus sediminis]MBP1935979.1 putative molybdopterin biosynthesis protein [Paenibacillus sediminis]